jgi:hypothetical protein
MSVRNLFTSIYNTTKTYFYPAKLSESPTPSFLEQDTVITDLSKQVLRCSNDKVFVEKNNLLNRYIYGIDPQEEFEKTLQFLTHKFINPKDKKEKGETTGLFVKICEVTIQCGHTCSYHIDRVINLMHSNSELTESILMLGSTQKPTASMVDCIFMNAFKEKNWPAYDNLFKYPDLTEKLQSQVVAYCFRQALDNNDREGVDKLLQYDHTTSHIIPVLDKIKCSVEELVIPFLSDRTLGAKAKLLKNQPLIDNLSGDIWDAVCVMATENMNFDIFLYIFTDETISSKLSSTILHSVIVPFTVNNQGWLTSYILQSTSLREKLSGDDIRFMFTSVCDNLNWPIIITMLNNFNVRQHLLDAHVSNALAIAAEHNISNVTEIILKHFDLREKILETTVPYSVNLASASNQWDLVLEFLQYKTIFDKTTTTLLNDIFVDSITAKRLDVTKELLQIKDFSSRINLFTISNYFFSLCNNASASDYSYYAEVFNLICPFVHLQSLKNINHQSPALFDKGSSFMHLLSPEARERIQSSTLLPLHTLVQSNITRNSDTLLMESFHMPRITYDINGEEKEYHPSTEDKVSFLQTYVAILKEAIETGSNEDIDSITFNSTTYIIEDAAERNHFLKRIRSFIPLVVPPVLNNLGQEINFKEKTNREAEFSPLLTIFDNITLSYEQTAEYEAIDDNLRTVVNNKMIGHEHFRFSPKTSEAEEWAETDKMISHITRKLEATKTEITPLEVKKQNQLTVDENSKRNKFIDDCLLILHNFASIEGYCFEKYFDAIHQSHSYTTDSVIKEQVVEKKQFEADMLNDLESSRNSILTHYLMTVLEKLGEGMHVHIFAIGSWILANRGFTTIGLANPPLYDLAAITVFREFGLEEEYKQWEASGKKKEGLETFRQNCQTSFLPKMLAHYTPLSILDRSKRYIDEQLKHMLPQNASQKEQNMSPEEALEELAKKDRARSFLKHMAIWMKDNPQCGIKAEDMLKEDYNYVEHFPYTDVAKLIDTLYITKPPQNASSSH